MAGGPGGAVLRLQEFACGQGFRAPSDRYGAVMTSPSSTPPDPSPAWLSTWQSGSSGQGPSAPTGPSPADVARGRDLRRTAIVVYPLVILGVVLLAYRDTARPWAGVAGLSCLVLAAVGWLGFFLQALAAARAERDSSSRAR